MWLGRLATASRVWGVPSLTLYLLGGVPPQTLATWNSRGGVAYS